MLAGQPRGQLTFGPGAAIPQPKHFRSELQDRCREGGAGGGWPQEVKVGEKSGKGGEKKENAGESDQSKKKQKRSCATTGNNHQHRKWKHQASKGVKLQEGTDLQDVAV